MISKNLKGLHAVPSACIFSILLKTQLQCYFGLLDADRLNGIDSGRHAATTLRRGNGHPLGIRQIRQINESFGINTDCDHSQPPHSMIMQRARGSVRMHPAFLRRGDGSLRLTN